MLPIFDLGSARGLPLLLGRFFFVGLGLLGFTKDRSPTDAFSEDDIVVTPRINHMLFYRFQLCYVVTPVFMSSVFVLSKELHVHFGQKTLLIKGNFGPENPLEI